jgi:hypothetical protein
LVTLKDSEVKDNETEEILEQIKEIKVKNEKLEAQNRLLEERLKK